MLSLLPNDILRLLSSSDEECLLMGHTDLISRTAEHEEHGKVRHLESSGQLEGTRLER